MYFYIQWHITDRCNLRCLHCYQEQFTTQNELPFSKLKLISRNLISTSKLWNKKLKIALTGGEPLLKGELWKLVDYLLHSNVSLSLISNGLLVNKYLPEIKQSGLDEFYISLDGITEETNDAIRGKDSFKKAIEGISQLKSHGFSVVIMFTLLKRNFQEAMRLFDFAKELKVDGYIIERFFPLGQGKKIADEVVSGKEIDSLYQHIFKQVREVYLAEEMIKYRAIQIRFDRKAKIYGAECIVGRDGLAILPDATVLPCRRFFFPIGNLLEKPLNEIWKGSKVLKKIIEKKNLKGKCNENKCPISDCYGCRAMTLAISSDYLGEDPHCWVYK
ncbi:MAG: radical SAM protein [bacterium]